MGATGDHGNQALVSVGTVGKPLVPCGCQGNQGPEAHGPLGGEIHSREGSHRGVVYPPTCSLRMSLPQMAPLILGVSLVVRYRFLPIFTSHIVD